MGQMIDIFTDFLYGDNYSNYLDLNALKKEIYDYIEKYSKIGNKISNVGGYQSENIKFDIIIDKDYSEIEKLLNLSLETASKSINRALFIDNAWININRSSDYNSVHSHPNCILSSVFYLNIPKNSQEGEGNIVFHRNRSHNDFGLDSAFNNPGIDDKYWSSRYLISPEDGDIIVFPSSLEHFVKPHYSDEDRISIAMNFNSK